MNNILLKDLYAILIELNKYFIQRFSIKYFAVSVFHIVYITLIVPYPGFRFYFPCFIVGHFLIIYLIFYFIGNKNIFKI